MSMGTRHVAEPTATRKYRNPSVHEVILDVQFHERLDDSTASAIPGHLKEKFGPSRRLDEQVFEVRISAEGQQLTRATKRFGGWRFETTEPTWVVQCSPDQLTMHAVRSHDWPSGSYIGWENIFARYAELLELVQGTYGLLAPKRVGLRYLNKIAVPKEQDFRTWVSLWFHAPGLLNESYAFDLRQTWASVEGAEDLSAALRLVKVKIDDEVIAQGNFGIVLDIEIFNLWVRNAPPFLELPRWFERAHSVENRVFESSITDALRSAFDQE